MEKEKAACGRVNLLYGGSDGDYEPMLFSVLSAMRRTDRALCVTVLTAALPYAGGKPMRRCKLGYLRGLLRARRDGSDLVPVDLSEVFARTLRKWRVDYEKNDPYPLLPLFADRCALSGKQLCLAPKTLFSGDAGEVFDEDLGDNPVGAVRDRRVSFLVLPDYADAEVLLIDMERAASCRFFDRARRVCAEGNPDLTAAVNNCGLPVSYLPGRFNERASLRRSTVIRSFRPRFRLLPYPHFSRADPRSGYGMPRREYRHFERVYEEYLLQREGRV